MDLLHRLGQSLAAKFSEQKTVQRLKRLDDRNLADLNQRHGRVRQIDIGPAAETDQPDTLARLYAIPLFDECHDAARD